MLFFRKRIKNKAEQTVRIQSKFGYFLLRLVLWLIFFGIGFAVFLTTDRFYKEMFFNSANYKAVGPLSKKDFIRHLTTSKTIVDNDAKKPYWEVYTLTDKHWEMKHYKTVLYFKVTIDEAGNPIQTKFLYDSDHIKIKGYKKKARTHLIVKQYFRNDKCVKEEVFNYANSKITKKFSSKDPALKILLFVNGYRPVANGGTPEQALMQIGNNGLEFPNSANVLYDADRFNYWRPWGNFDQRIIDRIKPNEVYYADGHHTVATSNHGSVIKFAKAAAEFPKPCKGNHHCEFAETATGTKVKTLSMLPFKANKSGFKQRRKNGAIAGFNLYQLLNEVPGASNNDTIFIVAHSMGYAYSLGMVDALRGKCNLGTYYIFCPENAESGNVIESEWLEVYQYGAIAKGPLKQAPCLQDGVAPQTKAGGLSSKNRLTFPKEYEKKMGFTGSHFIGFYDWVFNIPAGQPGAIRQR